MLKQDNMPGIGLGQQASTCAFALDGLQCGRVTDRVQTADGISPLLPAQRNADRADPSSRPADRQAQFLFSMQTSARSQLLHANSQQAQLLALQMWQSQHQPQPLPQSQSQQQEQEQQHPQAAFALHPEAAFDMQQGRGRLPHLAATLDSLASVARSSGANSQHGEISCSAVLACAALCSAVCTVLC